MAASKLSKIKAAILDFRGRQVQSDHMEVKAHDLNIDGQKLLGYRTSSYKMASISV